MAAKRIKVEKREHELNKETNPSIGDVANLNWVTSLLCHFLKELTNSELKQELLAQCMVKTVKETPFLPCSFDLALT